MQLSEYARKIIDTLSTCNEQGKVIEINLMPLTGKSASRHYMSAVDFMLSNKGGAYEAWRSNKIKFIVNKS